jgi:hypothetical protein
LFFLLGFRFFLRVALGGNIVAENVSYLAESDKHGRLARRSRIKAVRWNPSQQHNVFAAS